MTFVHWMQAVWFACLAVVLLQIHFLRRQSKNLKRQSERLTEVMLMFDKLIKRKSEQGDDTV